MLWFLGLILGYGHGLCRVLMCMRVQMVFAASLCLSLGAVRWFLLGNDDHKLMHMDKGGPWWKEMLCVIISGLSIATQ